VKLVADANVLLSAVIGGRAALVLTHPGVEGVFTTSSTFSEVQEYAAVLGGARGLSLDALLLAGAALPVSTVERDIYKRSLTRANRLVGKRNPDDVEILALALQLHLPLCSNDNDFERCGVEWYTTAELLKRLGISGRK
jgi:predicted nucleic acid-binding protein